MIMNRALKGMKEEQEMMDLAIDSTTLLIEEEVLAPPDSSLPSLTNHVPPIGTLDVCPTAMEEAPTEVDTAEKVTMMPLMDKDKEYIVNEMSGSVGKKVDDANMGMVDALDHGADSEKDPFDMHCADVVDLVSLKLLILFKYLKLN